MISDKLVNFRQKCNYDFFWVVCKGDMNFIWLLWITESFSIFLDLFLCQGHFISLIILLFFTDN